MIAHWGTALVLATTLAGAASASSVERKPFGTLPDGTAVEAVTLADGHGMTATILTLGAAVQSVMVPDRAGKPGDVVLGYDDLAGYVAELNYFGATVGRVWSIGRTCSSRYPQPRLRCRRLPPASLMASASTSH